MGILKLASAGLSRIIKFTFAYWWLLLGLIIIIPGLFASFGPDEPSPWEYLGNTVVSADQGVYKKVKNFEGFSEENDFKEKDTEEKINSSWEMSWFLFQDIWKNLILIYFNYRLFFAIWYFALGLKKSNKNKTYIKTLGFVYSIGTMAILQILVGGTPFIGLFALIKSLIGFFV